MPLQFSSLNEDAHISGISMKLDVQDRLAVYLEQMGQEFAAKCNIIHRKTVFQILIRLLRLVPVDTGRLRGSFTTYMQARGFNKYSAYIQQEAIGVPDRISPRKGFSTMAFQEGQQAGDFVDGFMNTMVGTNVKYASYVDERTSFLTKALIWGDTRYNQNFEQFLQATARAEKVVDPISDEETGQGGS